MKWFTVLGLFFLTGCGDVCWGPFGGDCSEPRLLTDSGKKLRIYTDPPVATVLWKTGQVQFQASGGRKPYRFTVREGGGEVGRTTGLYQADNDLGRVIIRVTDDKSDFAEAIVHVVDEDDEDTLQ